MDTKPPKSTKTGKRLRDSSTVLGITLVLTLITMEVFAGFGVPLSSKEEIAVVAGFWFVIVAGCVWTWRRFRKKPSR
jgi:hypothetical protein